MSKIKLVIKRDNVVINLYEKYNEIFHKNLTGIVK